MPCVPPVVSVQLVWEPHVAVSGLNLPAVFPVLPLVSVQLVWEPYVDMPGLTLPPVFSVLPLVSVQLVWEPHVAVPGLLQVVPVVSLAAVGGFLSFQQLDC